MLILELLRYASRGAPERSKEVADALRKSSPHEQLWALEAGLGPLMQRAVRGLSGETLPAILTEILLRADLTAQVRHSTRVDSALDVVATCDELGASVTVLKGISISEQCYPAPHLRAMSDIDILVSGRAYVDIESALQRQGLTVGHIVMGASSAHETPLHDPARDVWVEIHTALFPGSSRLMQNRVLANAGRPDFTSAGALDGHTVTRLCDEAQLLYIASYWTRDLSMHPIHPTFITPLLDAVVLLNHSRTTFDWGRLAAWLRDDQATASLYVLLALLLRHEVIELPAQVLSELARRQKVIGRAELRMLEMLLDRYLLRGRSLNLFHSWHVWLNLFEPGPRFVKALMLPWRVTFPPSYPHRYDLRAQAMRFSRLLQRLR